MDWLNLVVTLVLGAVVIAALVYFARTTWAAQRQNHELQKWAIAVRLAETPTVAAQSLALAAINSINQNATQHGRVAQHPMQHPTLTRTPMGPSEDMFQGYDREADLES